jgi:hypothetical protein
MRYDKNTLLGNTSFSKNITDPKIFESVMTIHIFNQFYFTASTFLTTSQYYHHSI